MTGTKGDMHIAFFNRSFHPDMSATGQLLTELAEGLVQQHGCRVSVIAGPPLVPAGGDRGDSPRWWHVSKWRPVSHERYRGVEIIRARGTRFSKRRFAGRFSNYVSYCLCACYAGLKLDRPDVVVALTDPPIIGLAAYLAARRYGAPLVMSYQDIFPEVARLLEDFQSEAVNRILQRVNCFLVRKADRAVTLGETMRQRLIEGKGADPGKVDVIPNWADCREISPGPKRNEFSLAHGLSDRFVVMHSGNIGLSQGLEVVVRAAVHLKEFPEIEFVVVGDGIKKRALEELARRNGLENVRFLPYQPKEKLTESFACADVFIISLKRGLAGYIVPSKVYGILAAGRPFVSAVEEASEIETIRRKHDCGLAARPDDARDLAEKILLLYQDRGFCRHLGANARRAALEFDRPLMIAAYHKLFRDVLPVADVGWSWGARVLKRAFDIAVAGAGLLGSLPVWVLVALAIKWEDGGPVFFHDQRVGRRGRLFGVVKFRTMIPNADSLFGPRQVGPSDPRVTKVGGMLRATAMDELPQLWNIFRGDMSFVGPRALRPGEIHTRGDGKEVMLESVPGYRRRHRVRPGLTGVAQIYVDRDVPPRHKFRYDHVYIMRQSFWLDIRLIALSFWITFRGRWERRGRKV
jgi:putative colanic acid biosynthesis glycosyltransferase WcaI